MEICLVAFSCLIALAMAASVRAGYLAGRRGRLAAGRRGESKVGEALDLAGGHDRLEGVVFGNSLRRSAQVDHLVRGLRTLVVVETKNWKGTLCGASQDRTWILSRPDGSRLSVRNPLLQARRQARVVAEQAAPLLPPVKHLVVMAGRVRHGSGGFPEGMIRIHDLRWVLPSMLNGGEGDPEEVERAWSRLVDQAFDPEADRRAARYVNWLEARFGDKPWRTWLVVAFALAAVAWTMALGITAMTMRMDGRIL